LANCDHFPHLLLGKPATFADELAFHLAHERDRSSKPQKSQAQEIAGDLCNSPRFSHGVLGPRKILTPAALPLPVGWKLIAMAVPMAAVSPAKVIIVTIAMTLATPIALRFIGSLHGTDVARSVLVITPYNV
jgi:hypothetical protein